MASTVILNTVVHRNGKLRATGLNVVWGTTQTVFCDVLCVVARQKLAALFLKPGDFRNVRDFVTDIPLLIGSVAPSALFFGMPGACRSREGPVRTGPFFFCCGFSGNSAPSQARCFHARFIICTAGLFSRPAARLLLRISPVLRQAESARRAPCGRGAAVFRFEGGCEERIDRQTGIKYT